MSDRQLEPPVRVGGMDVKHSNPGAFPFEAFEFETPQTTNPEVRLTGFVLDAKEGLKVGSGDSIVKITISTSDVDSVLTAGHWWIQVES